VAGRRSILKMREADCEPTMVRHLSHIFRHPQVEEVLRTWVLVGMALEVG
jgi:hypothetical protein